jgi:NAD(P)-dependent dehydrogenase (short-subunit alcohol dehydrogenase family)
MTALVIGTGGLARSIGERFVSAGRSVATITADAVFDDRVTAGDALRSAVGDSVVELVVLAQLDPAGFATAPITAITEQQWDDTCERSLRRAFIALQQAHDLVADGTPIVLILPNVGAVGVAGLVPLCTAVEGIRVMAKAVARRWGARSITVNTIGVELAAFMLGDTEDRSGTVPPVPVLGSPALPASSAVDDVVGLIEVFESPAGHAVTGAFLMADRGTVMLP